MERGDIWLVDLGYQGKIRPVMIMSVDYTDEERALITFIPRTTRIWPESRFDIPHKARGMKDGAFCVQMIGSESNSVFIRRVGKVADSTMLEIESALLLWLDIQK